MGQLAGKCSAATDLSKAFLSWHCGNCGVRASCILRITLALISRRFNFLFDRVTEFSLERVANTSYVVKEAEPTAIPMLLWRVDAWLLGSNWMAGWSPGNRSLHLSSGRLSRSKLCVSLCQARSLYLLSLSLTLSPSYVISLSFPLLLLHAHTRQGNPSYEVLPSTNSFRLRTSNFCLFKFNCIYIAFLFVFLISLMRFVCFFRSL